MTKVFLHRNRKKRLEQGHPWVYANEVDRIEGDAKGGDVVQVMNHQGVFLGKGVLNLDSQIRVRIMTYSEEEAIDEAFFVRRIEEAWLYRQRWIDEPNDCRLIYGEADFLPGLVVDKYGEVFVVQILSLGMELRKNWIVNALLTVFRPKGIYERSDVAVRELEGLQQRKGLLYGEVDRFVRIRENGLQYIVDVEEGQKTGFFFDQRENRAAVAPLMRGWGIRNDIRLQPVNGSKGEEPILRPFNKNGVEVTYPWWDGATVLECFAHTGSFTLNACKAGAKKVTCLDISEHAIETARQNVELNGYTDRTEFVVANAFDYLREQVDKKRSWDVVILDPPAFAKSKSAVKGAVRGYKDINLHGMKLVNERGFLVTASCSYHMSPDLFREVIQEAAFDAKKILRLVHWSGAGKDHPEILGVNEGHYLKFAIFEVRSRG